MHNLPIKSESYRFAQQGIYILAASCFALLGLNQLAGVAHGWVTALATMGIILAAITPLLAFASLRYYDLSLEPSAQLLRRNSLETSDLLMFFGALTFIFGLCCFAIGGIVLAFNV